MVVRLAELRRRRSGYAGLRLTADEYFSLADDGNRYELIDGVVTMSPSPSADHQRASRAIYDQLSRFVGDHNLGEVFYEIDVHFGKSPDGRDIVYRPDVICFLGPASREIGGRLRIIPNVAVEIVSLESSSRDLETKRLDYERFGVREYWLIDPIEERTTFFRLRDGKFIEAPTGADRYESTVVSGFQLDLARVRATFRSVK
jgi:Uma2 family endonuclease